MRKKLIEVALPLEAINIESAREKSIRHGHPSTLHLWWSRKPLATTRAILWASLVDDPSSWPDKFPTEEAQNKERQRLFDILGRIEIIKDKKGQTKQIVRGLVSWDEIKKTNSTVLAEAQKEIARCIAWERGDKPPVTVQEVREYLVKYAPPVYDPFCGGGSIPLEAQRLGLAAYGSDLNPVAVLITKALIEIPPKFKDQPPVNPLPTAGGKWYGAQGLAEDVRYYGNWMREEALQRIGHLYPKVVNGPQPVTPSPHTSHTPHTPHTSHTGGEGGPENSPHPVTPSPTGGEGGPEVNNRHTSYTSHTPHSPSSLPSPLSGRGARGEGVKWEISVGLKKRMKEIARQLRKKQTMSEEILWQAIRGAKLEGRKFRRQQPIGSFVVDFFCAAERLVVEIDGGIHESQKELDQERQALLESLGLRFVRISAQQVEQNLPLSLVQIKSAFTPQPLTPSPTRGEGGLENSPQPLTPSPTRGEGGPEINTPHTSHTSHNSHTTHTPHTPHTSHTSHTSHTPPSSLFLPSPLSGRGARGEGLTVIAWLWARTVKCPNPGCGCQMPLVQSFVLSTKKGKEAWVNPVIQRDGNTPVIEFQVENNQEKAPPGTVSRKGANCIACDSPVTLDHVRSEGKAGRMGAQLMAIVAEGKGGRVYLSPDIEHIRIAQQAQPEWQPESDLPEQALGFRVQVYGMTKHSDLFTPRQLVALTTFSDLVTEAREKVKADAITAGMSDDGIPLNEGGIGATAYGDAVGTYLAFGVDKIADYHSTICSWHSGRDTIRNTFARQAIPMSWDFAEANPLSDSTGNFNGAIDWVVEVIKNASCTSPGEVKQLDAVSNNNQIIPRIISTDPPYYDNIGYADLSDYFYVWLRRSLQSVYPNLFATLLVPKTPELVATPYRFGGDKKKAKSFFEEGLGKAFVRMNEISNPDYPLTVYYAFKQAETTEKDSQEGTIIASTGWETMLEGLLQANFSIGGTWPMRSELSNRMVASGTNALASSIVLVCRPRPVNAPKATRRQFVNELKRDLPQALKLLQQGNIAPVDLAQASIGPGMAIFSQYKAVLEANGAPLKVRAALQMINQILDEFLTEQEGEFDNDTRWALTWFEQYQFNEGQYGDAETLSKAKNTSVQGLVDGGVLEAKGGKVRLLKREELPANWQPEKDTRIPIWKVTQYLIHILDKQGELIGAQVVSKLGVKGELARDLAYRLYSLCDRLGWTQDAIAYNTLVTSWSEITRLSVSFKNDLTKEQLNLF